MNWRKQLYITKVSDVTHTQGLTFSIEWMNFIENAVSYIFTTFAPFTLRKKVYKKKEKRSGNVWILDLAFWI